MDYQEQVEQRLKLSMEILKTNAQEEKEELKRRAEEFESSELEKVRSEITEEMERRIHEGTMAIREQTKNEIAEFENTARQQLFQHREELVMRVIETTAKQLSAYSYTEKYEREMLQKVQEIGEHTGLTECVLRTSKRDEPMKKRMEKAFGMPCTVEVNPKIVIGGFEVICRQRGYFIDETLDSRLNDQKEWFYSHCGFRIIENQLSKVNK